MSSRRRGRLILWRRRRSDAALRCAVEALESRTLLSTTLTVTSLADSGAGTLRAAITSADSDTGQITINFNSGLTGTITLASELPAITGSGDVTIDGPGANLLTVNGGGFASVFTDQSATLEIENMTITGGGTTSTPGSGVFNHQGTLSLVNTTITGNKAADGGAVYNYGGSVYILDSTISNNSSIAVPSTFTSGGGIYNSVSGEITITGSTIEDNTAAFIGGGICNAGTLTIIQSTITSNSAEDGGGIFSGGTLTITQSTISDNSSTTGNGAGIDNTGELTVTGSTINGNISVGNGGGIYSYYDTGGASLTVTNSTIVGNSAINGGGIDDAGPFDYDPPANLATLTDCTLTGNTASGAGGGIYYRYTGSHTNTITIDGSIVAANTGKDLASSAGRTVFVGSYDLIGDGSGSSLLTSSHLGSSGTPLNPDLAALANNGGPTETCASTTGSPAIGNGAVFAAADGVDQRGDARTAGSVDIGAYQSGGSSNLAAPVVTTNPTSASVPAGQTVTFTAAATGNPTPTIQWQVSTNGGSSFTNIPGAISTTYSFTTTSGENGYEYQAVFTNSQNTATSIPATLTVTAALAAPVVTTNPTSASIPSGQTVTFTAAATGNPTPTVQWQLSTNGGSSFTNISGATSTTYSFTTSIGENGYEYRAVFTNSQNTATTTAATLTVTTPPVVTTNPVSASIPAGQTVTFTAAATGSPTPTVQWQVSTNGGSSFTNIAGATSTTYSFTTTSGENGYEYQAVFTNSQNSATTTAATLTVTAALVAPMITTNPTSASIPSGQTVTFTAAATGNPTPTVQWQISTDSGLIFTNIAGATSTTYSFTTTSSESGYEYRAVFTNSQSSATTTTAILTVTAALAPPVVTTNPSSASIPAGQTVTFTTAATGNPTPTVQWQVSTNGGSSFTNIAGATSTTYSFTTTSGQNGYAYQAVFTNSQSSATTTTAILTVTAALAPPEVTTNPVSASIPAGQTVTFTTAATGNPTPTVQWQVSTNGGSSFTNIAGATSTTYSFTTTSGQNGYEYQAVFTNSQNSATTTAATLTVTAALAPPVVTTNPVSASIPAGQTVTFTAAATGNPMPTVQWQVSTDGGSTFTNIAGATSTTYSFTTTSGQNGYEYQAVFTNSQNSATTTTATLTVTAALAGPAVTTNPVSASIPAGQTVTFTAAATGNPVPTVQWQVSTDGGSTFNNIAGATSTTYSFTTTSGDNGYEYQVVFTNSQNSATTTAATLTVTTALTGPVVTNNPTSTSIPAGQTATFTAAATGNPAPTVQWQVSTDGGSTFTNIVGATSTTYSFTTNSGDNGYEYQAVFTNSQNSATTTAATLTVTTALTGPVVTNNPTSTSIPAGQTATFTAAATGNPAPTVQWQVSTDGGSTFNNIAGATSTTYSFTTTAGDDGYEYQAVFTNSQNSATTTTATLTVTAALAGPVVTTNPVSASIPSGQTATFTAAATGNPAPTVQWQVSTDGGSTFTNIVGATSTTYSFTTTSGDNSYEYQAVFTNSQNSATTTAATLTVTAALAGPAVTTNPVSASIPSGQTATFTAAATGNPAPTVQWQVSTDGGSTFSNIAGATSTTYSFTTTSGDNGYEYQAVFTNSQNSATTTTATLTVTAALAGPVVTTNPVSASIPAGQTATFTAAATGNPVPTVQWQVSTNGGTIFTNIAGATSATYSFTTTSGQNGDKYRAVFTNSQNTATTNAATLTVTAALAGPVVTTNPTNASIASGKTATFTAAATGNPTPTVQWQVSTNGGSSFSNIAGATSTTYSFTTTSGDNGYEYQAVFTNSQSTATTTAATLTIPAAPVIKTNPANASIPAGQTATFTAAATGSPVPTVQWQISTNSGKTFTNIAGATSTTYSFTTASNETGHEYRAVFTNSQSSATTTAAKLTVTFALTVPVIKTSPKTQSVKSGATVTFTASATGNPTPTVQWQISTNGGSTYTNIAGATSATYSFKAAAGENGSMYRAVFTNSQGTATTAAATLTVTSAPVVTINPVDASVPLGQTATFTAAATGNPTATVQWYLSTNGGSSFTKIAGATSTTLSFTMTSALNGNRYQAVFTNSLGTATTAFATLTIFTVGSADRWPRWAAMRARG
jgi:large repetitive protein